MLYLISVSSFLNCFALFKMRLLILLLSYKSFFICFGYASLLFSVYFTNTFSQFVASFHL